MAPSAPCTKKEANMVINIEIINQVTVLCKGTKVVSPVAVSTGPYCAITAIKKNPTTIPPM